MTSFTSVAERPSLPLPLPLPVRAHPRRRRHVWLVALLSAGLVVAVGTALDLSRRAALPRPPMVLIAPVGNGLVTGAVRGAGIISPVEEMVLAQPAAARITRLAAAPGDHVLKGQVLARIDLLALRADLARATADLAGAETAAVEAALKMLRVRKLRVLPQLDTPSVEDDADEIEDVATGRAVAAATKVEAFEAAYLVARQRLRQGVVRAPADGTVLSREAAEGEIVAAGAVLFRLAPDPQRLQVIIPVSEADAARIAVGQTARFTVPAHPGHTFMGQVVRLLPLVGPESARHLPAVIAVDRNAAGLRAGMTAAATIHTPTHHPVLRVPVAALLFAPRTMTTSADDPAIWVSDAASTQLVRTPVEVGVVDGAFAEVRAPGLREGAGVAVGYALPSK